MTVTERHEQVWVGIDAGKAHHWAVGVNASGEKVFSRKVVNGEDEILALMVAACEMADEVRWAVDICGRASTLLLALLIAHGQSVVYVPGRTVDRMSGTVSDLRRRHSSARPWRVQLQHARDQVGSGRQDHRSLRRVLAVDRHL